MHVRAVLVVAALTSLAVASESARAPNAPLDPSGARRATASLATASLATDAASYTIQVDDQDTFRAPYVASQTVSASQATLAGLPAQTLWFLVRGNAADGTPGAWSAARRFELR